MSLLEVEGLHAGYGQVVVLRRRLASASSEGKKVAILGPNGAGKTTTLRAICGMVEHAAGSVEFDGQSLAGKGRRPDRAAAASPTCPRAAARSPR